MFSVLAVAMLFVTDYNVQGFMHSSVKRATSVNRFIAVAESENPKDYVWPAKPAEIEVHHLTKFYRADLFSTKMKKALDDVSLLLNCFMPIAVVGDAGSGKSTLMKCISGRKQPTSGTVTVSGDHSLVYLTRDFSFDPSKSVSLNIQLVLSRGNSMLNDDEVRTIVDIIISMTELEDQASVKAKDLSGSEILIFGLALALAKGAKQSEPPVLFCDGFLDHDDERLNTKVEGIMRNLARKYGVGIIFSSHSMNTVLELSDAAIVMSEGQVIQTGPAADMSYVQERLDKKNHRSPQQNNPDMISHVIDDTIQPGPQLNQDTNIDPLS